MKREGVGNLRKRPRQEPEGRVAQGEKTGYVYSGTVLQSTSVTACTPALTGLLQGKANKDEQQGLGLNLGFLIS